MDTITLRFDRMDPSEEKVLDFIRSIDIGKRTGTLVYIIERFCEAYRLPDDPEDMAKFAMVCSETGYRMPYGSGEVSLHTASTASKQRKEKKPKKATTKQVSASTAKEKSPAPVEGKTRPAAPVQPARQSAVQETPQPRPSTRPRQSEPPAPEPEPIPPRPVKPPIPQWSYKDEKGHQQALDISEQDQQLLYDYYQEIYWKWFNLRTDVADVDYDPEKHRRDASEEEDPLSDVPEDVRDSIREAYNNLTPNGKIDFHETLAEGLPAHKAIKLAQFTR